MKQTQTNDKATARPCNCGNPSKKSVVSSPIDQAYSCADCGCLLIENNSPLPWKYGSESGHIYSIETGIHIATIHKNEWQWKGRSKANAALIVTAVNEHAALCAVAEAAELALRVLEILPPIEPVDHNARAQDALRASLSTLANLRKQNGGV